MKKNYSKKHFQKLYAQYIIKKGIIDAGNNSEILQQELKKIINQLEKL